LAGVKNVPVCQLRVAEVCQLRVKSNFAEFHDNKLNKLIGYRSVTDNKYKLEIHIINFVYKDYLDLGITEDDKIKVIGIMQTR